MGSHFGKCFSITTFGESHGAAVGVVIEGIPSKTQIDLKRVQEYLNRRRPGQSPLTSPRNESDIVECLSGLEGGVSLGTPLTLLVRNSDQRPSDYDSLKDVLRPSHADFTNLAKYGIKASSGGGRSSARETIGRVAAGAIAEQVLEKHLPHFAIVAWVQSVENITAPDVDELKISRDDIEKTPTRTPDPKTAAAVTTLIESVKSEGDSVGGVIRCIVRGLPAGLGDPVFDKLEADLAKAMLSLPATKGFEIGSGFQGTTMRGSQHNDPFIAKDGKISTLTNHSGGIQGGISNGEVIYFRVAFKPVATIAKIQASITVKGNETQVSANQGRHDPCVLPRAVPMVEAMTAIVLLDHWLRNRLIQGSANS